MIPFKEYGKNKHLTDFLEIKESIIANHLPRSKPGLKSEERNKSEQNMMKDY